MYKFSACFSAVFGQLHYATDEEGALWFCAPDAYKSLDLNRAQLRRIAAEDRKNDLFSLPGSRRKLQVSEAGLYDMIFMSRKPEAKAFKCWVTHEVLPSIRKNGGYVFGQEQLSGDDLRDLEDKIRELSEAVAKANLGKKKLAGYLAQEEDHNHDLFAMYLSEKQKREKVEENMIAASEYLSDANNVSRFLAAIKAMREMDSRKAEFRAMDLEAKNAESRIPYAAAEPAHDPDPMVKLPDGTIGRRSELMARDKH